MNEIALYRGKSLSSHTWLYGCLLIYGRRCFIIPSGDLAESEIESRFYWNLLEKDDYEVNPKTVGQFTGLYTVAEHKVWAQDIVRYNDELYIVQRECDTPGGYWAETGYILKQIGVADYMSFTDTIDDYCNEICVEIVGNAHDNPELLRF